MKTRIVRRWTVGVVLTGAVTLLVGDFNSQPLAALQVSPTGPSELPKAPSPARTGTPPVSREAADLIKLKQAGVEDSVVQVYLENLKLRRSPTAAEVIYMSQRNVSPGILANYVRGSYASRAAARTTGARRQALPLRAAASASGRRPVTAGGTQTPAYWAPVSSGYSGMGWRNLGDRNHIGRTVTRFANARSGVATRLSNYGIQGSWGGGTPVFHPATYGPRGSWGGSPVFHSSTYGPRGSWGGGSPVFHSPTYGSPGSWGGGSRVSGRKG